MIGATNHPRYALRASIVVACIGFFLLSIHIADCLGQYRTYDYILGLVNGPVVVPSHASPVERLSGSADKVIVVAKLEKEDTEWIKDYLPE